MGQNAGAAPAKAGGYSAEKPKEMKEKDDEAPKKVDASEIRERHWNGLSKKELEEECTLRGLGKKGSKEDLIVKLINYHQDLKSSAAASGGASASKDEASD